MFLHTNLMVILSRSQGLQFAHVVLIFVSVLAMTVIVYVYHWKLTTLHEEPTMIFALKLDRSPEPSFEQKFENLIKELPGLPLEFIQQNGYRKFRISKACAQFPDIFALEIHNNFWQTHRNGQLLVRLYGAYYDNRLLDHNAPVVRLLVLINQMMPPKTKDFCQIWFEHTTKPTIVKVSEYKPIWQTEWTNSPNLLYPYMLTCVLPSQRKYAIPKAVSLVGQPCENAGNVLRIHYEAIQNITAKKSFGVCVKGMSQPLSGLSSNLIEWLEILHEFGIGKVHFSIFYAHPKVEKVINYYRNLSYVDSEPTTIGNMAIASRLSQHILLQNDEQNKRLHDAIIAHDCFYRNLYSYDYVVFLDTDSVPMPLHATFDSWHAVLKYAEPQSRCKNITRLCLRNTSSRVIKEMKVENRENDDDVATFLSNQKPDMRFNNETYATCWHSTNFMVLMDDRFGLRSNDCSFKLKTNVAQLQYFYAKNEHPANDTQRSKLTDIRSQLKQRIELVAKKLNLN